MSKATTNGTIWAPINDAVGTAVGEAIDRAMSINDQARKLAKRTLKTVRTRSEALLADAQERTDRSYRSVRETILAAGDAVDARRNQVGELVEQARSALFPLESSVRRGVESIARQLHLATTNDVDSLRKRLHALERKLEQTARSQQHAA